MNVYRAYMGNDTCESQPGLYHGNGYIVTSIICFGHNGADVVCTRAVTHIGTRVYLYEYVWRTRPRRSERETVGKHFHGVYLCIYIIIFKKHNTIIIYSYT